MAWAFVRPADRSLLSGRPLLDLGCGDGQTLRSLAADGVAVGVDRSLAALRAARLGGVPRLAAAEASRLPFRCASIETVLAADLFHHLDDADLTTVIGAVADVLRPQGRLVAWWYSERPHEAPDAPRYPRTFDAVAETVRAAGFEQITPLELDIVLPGGPATVGLTGTTRG